MSIDEKTKKSAEEEEVFLASLPPSLPAKMKWDKKNRSREREAYTLLYEKTYSGGSTEGYESSVKAESNEEAITFAAEKLMLKDALAHWSTNITDAYLVSPKGEKLLIPGWSKAGDKKR